MKLHELGARRPQEQVARVFESHLGGRIDVDRIAVPQARHMLGRVRSLIREHRAAPSRHYSEKNPDYLKLVMLEQALIAHIREQASMGAASSGSMATTTPAQTTAVIADPKTKTVMDKVKRGQSLTPDEQQTMNKIALTKEAKKTKRLVRESEIQTAQVVLAAKDMIDRVQGMLEDVSEMQFKDLPALSDSIKNDMGVEQSQQFQSQAAAALTTLLQAMQAGKTELEAAQGVLTGQAPVVPGGDMMGDAGTDPLAGDADADVADLDVDAEIATADDEEDDELAAVSLGRERR